MVLVEDANATSLSSSSSLLMSDFLSKYGGVAVIDGGVAAIDSGLATELERHGADLNDPLWSAKCLITSPHLIRSVHLDYLEAGADIIITASYQATIQGFKAKGFSQEESEELLKRSVEIAREAREAYYVRCSGSSSDHNAGGEVLKHRPILVAASVGSYGAYLADGSEYSGDYGDAMNLDFLKDFHRRRVQLLAESGPDLIAFETVPNRLEAQAFAQLLEEEDINVPAWLSFNSKDGINVVSGDSLAECAAIAESCKKVVAVGINCTPPRFIQDLILSVRKVTAKPILIYPNSGESYDADQKQWVIGSQKGLGSIIQVVTLLCKGDVLTSVPLPSSGSTNLGEETLYSKHFEELQLLGSGGFARVYKCRHRLDNMEYAVKIIPFIDENEEKTLRELKAISMLQHPNIVRYRYAWIEDGVPDTTLDCGYRWIVDDISDSELDAAETCSTVPSTPDSYRPPTKTLYLAMECCKCSLGDALSAMKFTVNETKMIFRGILEGLRYMHAKNVIHGDLSPQNIFLDYDGVPKIGDFGLAVFLEEGQDDISCSCVGNFNYLAPEVIEGWRVNKSWKVSKSSDMYSFALVMMEILHPVGTDMERLDLFSNIKVGDLPEISGPNYVIEAHVHGILISKPSLRFTAEQVFHDFFGN